MAKREKKGRLNLKIWVPIICILVVVITFFMIHDIQNKVKDKDVSNTTNTEENQGEEISNETESIENDVQNEITNSPEDATTDSSQNTNPSAQNTTVSTNKNNTSPTQPGITDQKQKAIELVKKELQDDTVNYVFDYVNEKGEYVVAVKDKVSATVKYYFRVNLETGAVELD